MISKKIKEIEDTLLPEAYLFNNSQIWPYIRISLHLSTKKRGDSDESIPVIKKLLFIVLGLFEFFKWKTGRWKKVDNLFLSSAHYKVKEGRFYYDRIIDPFLNLLQSNKQNFAVLEFASNLKYKTDLSYYDKIIKIQPVLYFLSFLWRLEFIVFKRRIKDGLRGDYIKLNKVIEKHSINWRFDDNILWRLFLLEKQISIFENLLKSLEVKKAGVVCYYDFKSLAFVNACNRRNIPVIDFQHGVQGSHHMAYSQWPESLRNSNFFPDYFWVWDENSYKNIAEWKNPSKVLLGINKWFYDRKTKESEDIILFSLQPVENPIPEILIKAIKEYSGTKKWFFRLHPQQIQQKSKFEEILRNEDLLHIINIDEATSTPLTVILKNTLIHITYYSSVTIEASYFNIPTIFLDYRGNEFYKSQLSEELVFNPTNYKEILTIIKSLEGDNFKRINSRNFEVNRFSKIQNFFNIETGCN